MEQTIEFDPRKNNVLSKDWLQVEIPSDQGNTAFVQFRMANVTQAVFIRQGDTDKIIKATVVLEHCIVAPKQLGQPQQDTNMLSFEGETAQFVYDQWSAYVSLAAAQEKSKPSIIHRPAGSTPFIK